MATNLITKTAVAPGIFWVEIPSADFRVLCGSPADAVKHLMLRGLVVPTEKNGVFCETGPNAILLSDLNLQAGAFSNMAEFPVLQMLYRQGMLLPGHPNNTGAKPLLIGHPDQIKAQLNYIYRGNYGLISEKEIMATGVPEDQAKMMMRMKLKFAFGAIKETEAFLDSCAVGDQAVEVVPGVSIQRLGLNKFQFSCEDESVEVNLNLEPDQSYASPYPLNFHMIDRGYFEVIHSGDGDGWDVRRPSMASILIFQGRVYLIDAGPNIAGTLRALGIGINEVEGIFHTHSHDDHFAGITSLIRAGHRIKYFATPLVRTSVTKKLSALLAIEEEAFADFFHVVDLPMGEWTYVSGMEVKPIFSPHPVETTLFKFRAPGPDGEASYAHYADIAAFKVLAGMVTEDEEAPGISAGLFEETKTAYLEPATVKKIDAGGGMIHGEPEDFREDSSAKIILSHRATEFTHKEKEIGSGAPFGTKETLIQSYQNFHWRAAYQHLRSYFPNVDADLLRSLTNNRIKEINPEEIILREGQEIDKLFLIVTGTIDVLNEAKGKKSTLSAGALIGDEPLLRSSKSPNTYRTSSFVRALIIQAEQFTSFVRSANLFEDLAEAKTMQSFLQDFQLLDEEIPQSTYLELARYIDSFILEEGDEVDLGAGNEIMLVSSGRLERMFGGRVVENIGVGDFFGEERAIFNIPSTFDIRVAEKSEICRLPAHILGAIPVLRWKFLEAMEHRRALILDIDQRGMPVIEWRRDYALSIRGMDDEHKRLFSLADHVLAAVRMKDKDLTDIAFGSLIDYAHVHFNDEEKLLAERHYPSLERHKELHKGLIADAENMREQIKLDEVDKEGAFRQFFGDWLIKHILNEDKKYANFLHRQDAAKAAGF